MSYRCLAIALAIAVLPVGSLTAQTRKAEIGFDATLQVQFNEDAGKYTQFGLPGGYAFPEAGLRIGFPVSGLIAFEPMLGFAMVDFEGEDNTSVFRGVLGIVINSTRDLARAHVYVRPYGGFDLFSGGGDSESQLLAGLGLGFRVPIDDRLALRAEGGFARGFENDDLLARDMVVVRVGLSMYLK